MIALVVLGAVVCSLLTVAPAQAAVKSGCYTWHSLSGPERWRVDRSTVRMRNPYGPQPIRYRLIGTRRGAYFDIDPFSRYVLVRNGRGGYTMTNYLYGLRNPFVTKLTPRRC